MTARSIDDIFSKKGKAGPAMQGSPVTTTSSTSISPRSKHAKITDGHVAHAHGSVQNSKADLTFTDLKGVRAAKRTTEGYRVYNEDELKINPESGLTNECPFDCQCCF